MTAIGFNIARPAGTRVFRAPQRRAASGSVVVAAASHVDDRAAGVKIAIWIPHFNH
jgi:hypothetical protein